jgi:long-chain fatty acid transport protein
MTKSLFNKSLLCSSISQHAKLIVGAGLTAVMALPASQALAGGFQLSDHSVTGLGRNHAGYGVVGDDASAVQFNPAGLTLLRKKQVQFGAVINMVSADIEDNGTNLPSTFTGNSSEDGTPSAAVVPSFYYVHPVNDKLVLGLGFTAPFGTNTDYSDEFFGRFNGKKTELTALDLNPAFGYKINDTVSIGGGISVQKVDVTLGQAIWAGPGTPEGDFEVEGDSVEVGYNLGVTFNLADDSRLGLSYRSGIKHDIEGDADFIISGVVNANVPATAEFESPATAYLGYYKPLSNDYFFTAGVRWTQWSAFEEIRIKFPEGGTAPLPSTDAVTPIQWKDSYTYSVGLDGRINQQWGWRTGVSFTETPVPDSTRSVRTVDSDRTAISFGATYNMSPKLTVDLAYRYISFADGPINRQTLVAGTPVGSTVANIGPDVHTVAIQANYKF